MTTATAMAQELPSGGRDTQGERGTEQKGTVQVVVQGHKVRPPVPPKDWSVAGSMIRADRLQGPGLRVPELLRAQPGMTVVETGGYGALSTASIRGATSAQTPVYLAGVRLNDDVAGTADLSLVPLWLIDRVEVYRGNAPLQADRLGIGGAIFFEPRRPRRTGAGVGGTLGSFGTRAGWADASTGDESASALVGVRVDSAANDYRYLDDRGTRFDPSDDVWRTRTNADVRMVDVWALGQAVIDGEMTVDLVVNGVQREQGIPGMGLLPTRAARGTYQRSLFGMTLQSPCAGEGRCSVIATSSALIAHTALDDPWSEIALQTGRLDMRGERAEQSCTVRVDVTDSVSVSPSVRAAVERLDVTPLGGVGMRASRVFSRGALGGEWRILPWLTARGLASGECNGTSQRQATFCDSVQPSGRMGLQVGQRDLMLLANVGHYVRVPGLGELYGISGAVRGNPDLVPETGATVEVGVRAASGRLGPVRGAFVDLFVFTRMAEDLVAYRRSSLGYIRPYNVGVARIDGLEALGGIEALSFFRAELSLTLLDPRDRSPSRTTTNDILPFRSRLVVSPRADLFTEAFHPVGIHYAGLGVQYVHQSSRYADQGGLVVIPSQGTLDIEAEIRVLAQHVSVRARLVNVLDQQRYDLVGYPLPGRGAYVSMEARW